MVRKDLIALFGTFDNSLKTKDDRLFKAGFREWENAMQHNIPVQATFTLFKYLQVVPSFNYTERWYTRKVMKSYDETTQKWDTHPGDTIHGFYRVFNYSASLALSTKMYGMYQPLFMKKKEIQIRHVFTPQISLNGSPSFGQFWEYYRDADGNDQYYSPYSSQQFGTAPREKSGTVSFDVSNNLEMKYRNKKDSLVKVSLIVKSVSIFLIIWLQRSNHGVT